LVQEIRLASGATEADITRALASLTSGGTLILPKGETIAISKGLTVDVSVRDITLDLNGSTLQQVGAVSVVLGKGLQTKAESVGLGTNADGNTTVSYAKLPADIAVGDWIKVVSDNALPGDMIGPDAPAPTLMGQALQVASITGNVVTFKGALIDQANYTTNIRAATYTSGELVVKNGEIIGDTTHNKPAPALVQLRDIVDARVEHLSVHDGKGYGVGVVNSVNAFITDVSVKNLADASTTQGIAVQSMSSTGTTVKGLYAENVTHATDANAIGATPGAAYISQFGGDIGFTVSDAVAYGTRNFAFSWHSESVNGSYDNVQAFDSFGFLQARGLGGTVTDSGGANNVRGVSFFEWGHEDARNISLDHITLKETGSYSTIALNKPVDNKIANSFFESFSVGNLATAENVTVTNTTYTKATSNPNDVISGSGGDDLLLGGKGNDTLGGAGGDDYIWGGQGVDTLTGGTGRDRFAYHSVAEGGDIISDFQAGANGDVIDLSVIAAKLNWADGDVVANGYARFVQSGNNVLAQVDQDGAGSGGFATVATLLDRDVADLSNANFHALLWAPELTATPEPQPQPPAQVQPPAQAEVQPPAPAPAQPAVQPQPDNKLSFNYAQEATSNALNGDDANNKLTGDSASNRLYGNGGNDILSGLDGDDLLVGGDGDDQLLGGNGNDMLSGGRGADALNGGAGFDTATYVTAESGVTVNLADASKNTGEAAGDRFTAIENLTGGNFNDVLTGNQSANVLDGGKGDDTLNGAAGIDKLNGGDGNDWLDGGAGQDTLTGGGGADRFYFASAAEAGDTITDFKPGEDHIVINAAGFGISPDQECSFQSAAQIYLYAGNAAYAPTTCPTLLYNSTTGRLLLDADGSGEQKAQLVAVLTNAPQITADDFLIV
jgi:Ca2+-binding RTX toxin-like protein